MPQCGRPQQWGKVFRQILNSLDDSARIEVLKLAALAAAIAFRSAFRST